MNGQDADRHRKRAATIVRILPGLSNLPYSDPTTDLDGYVDLLTKHYPDDFTWSSCFDGDFLAELMYRGFLTMSAKEGGVVFMLPKLHVERCVLDFDDLHVPKKVRKVAKKFDITVDQAFDKCVDGINNQHKDSWFYPPLVEGFKAIFDRREQGCKEGRVRLHSVEVWQDDQLVAGEVGYAVGGCYTSLSGFSNVNSSGTVQCILVAILLKDLGFSFWDLGMELDYKIRMGARSVPRVEFLQKLKDCRDQTDVILRCPRENCGDVLNAFVHANRSTKKVKLVHPDDDDDGRATDEDAKGARHGNLRG